MRLRYALLMVCLALVVNSANAQFQVWFLDEFQVITNACGGGTPVPDGTTIQVWWDSTANGIGPGDVQPQEGFGFQQANFNQFLLNGMQELGTPGTFAATENFVFAANTPNPGDGTGHPVFYLRICLDNSDIHWVSDTFRVQTGYQEVYFGTGPGEIPFTCVAGACGGCPSPAPVSNFTASQNLCNSILVNWTHSGENVAGYRLLVNSADYVYIPGAANTSYTITGYPGGIDIPVRCRAYRICGTGQDADTAFSTAMEVTGRSLVTPPTPQNMSATDDSCGSVYVRWSVNTVLGLDSFRVFREGVRIGSLNRGSAGQVRTFVDNAPLAGVASYCVYGYSTTCSTGTGACDNGRAGAAPVCTINNIAATSDDCDEVCVTWTANCPDAVSFQILRSNVSVGTVPATGGPNYSFCHAPVAGQVGQYQVRAVNACGNGTLQPATPVPGTRLAAPGNVQTIVASDTLCDKVRVTWAALAGTDSFQIRRDGNTIGSVAGGVLLYDDFTAVAGVTYSYTVVAFNQCGAGSVATGNTGTRRAAGTGTATFTLVTAGPPNWTYSMTVNSGCLNTVVIRDFCAGTTATAPTGWTVTVDNDSIIFTSTTSYGATETVTGFVLSHPTCDGDGRWSSGQSGGTIRGPLPVGENAALPTEYSVKVFPNPFNPQTNFKIAVPNASETRIVVFNINGQVVRDMNLGRLQAGYHTVQFGGSELPSGMYFARIQAGSFHSTHKLMLLK